MAKGSEIAETVLGIVQDPSFDEDYVMARLNDCAKAISRKLILPSLDTEATVTTSGTSSVLLPLTYQRNLYSCRNAFNLPVGIVSSRDQLHIDYGFPTPGVKVLGVAAVGRNILYSPIPFTPETLTINFQRIPTKITGGTEVDLLPNGFEDLFQHYACWKAYEKIEQGIEGAKVDTNYYMALYIGMLDELELSLTEGVSLPPPPIARMERW